MKPPRPVYEMAELGNGARAVPLTSRAVPAHTETIAALRLLGVFLVAAVGVLFIYLAIVRIVDPHGHFGTGTFPVLVQEARREKLALYRQYARPPVGGLVFGSSRSMKIDPKLLQTLTGQRFFNFGVSSGRVEDYLALYRWAVALGSRPRTIIVGLDVEALHNNDVMETPLEFADELRSLLDGSVGVRTAVVRLVKKYKRAIGISHLMDVPRSIGIYVGLLPEHRTMRFEPDGLIDYLERRPTPLVECSESTLHRYAGMTHLSPRRKAMLERLVTEAGATGATVKIWITPLNPATELYIEARAPYRRLLDETREFLAELHRAHGVEVYDYSRPQAFGASAADWYDCYHMDQASSDLVVRGLAGRRS